MSVAAVTVERARILVVEDEVLVARDISQQLREIGYEAVADSTTGEEALALAERLRPDLVLMDIQLAGPMDGVEAARIMRERWDLPVVFLTAFAGEETLRRAKEAGPFGYIVKPFGDQDLRITIEMALFKHRTEGQVRLLGAALEAVANSVVITDPSGNIEWVNAAFTRATGYAPEEVVGRNPRVLKSGRQGPEVYAEMWRAIAAGNSWHGEFVNRRKDGSLFNEDVTITPVRDDSGHVLHYVAIKQDITVLKQSLAELGRAHAELAAKNRALDAALKEARAAVEAKAAFLATMSHELRTPMNGVVGMAGVLRGTAPLTAEQADCVETIYASGTMLLGLINDILDFSKVDAGKMELERRPFDPRRCVGEAVAAVASRAREKGLELVAETAPDLPGQVLGDGPRLRQVLMNLLGNAVKFTPKGRVSLRTTATPEGREHVRLKFEVEDTGIGIPQDKQNRLFQVFTQVDSSTARMYGGSGLGLAISQKLLGLMGGRIEVESEAGLGAVFRFDLRLQISAAVAAVDAEAEAALAAPPTDGPRLRVLLAEDNAINLKVALAMLRRLGCQPRTATTGREALAACATEQFDLVLMDVQMPEMDGLEATRRIRRLMDRQPVIVAMTANAMDGDRELCLEAGMDDYVTKPITLDTLRRALACQRRGSGKILRNEH